MISLELAQRLRAAGLGWEPALYDFFTVPFRGLDKRRFIIGDMLSYVEIVQGRPAVTFHGALEWALDYVFLTEVVWLPTEAQLRELLERRLLAEPDGAFELVGTPDGYRCTIRTATTERSFDAFGAADAYALALLEVGVAPE